MATLHVDVNEASQSCSLEQALAVAQSIVALDREPVAYRLHKTAGTEVDGVFSLDCETRRENGDGDMLRFNCGFWHHAAKDKVKFKAAVAAKLATHLDVGADAPRPVTSTPPRGARRTEGKI